MTQTPQDKPQEVPESLKKWAVRIIYPIETPPKEAMTEQEYAELHPDDGEVFELVGFTQEELIDQVVGLGGGTCTEAETADQVLAIREGKYDI
jgi:alcohol dehydrogenase class IV